MGKHKRRRELAAPWSNLQTAIWLIGLAILFWRGWWWPGILVLVGISMAAEALISMMIPQALEPEEPDELPMAPAQTVEPPRPVAPPVPAPAPIVAEPPRPIRLLPSECPRCGGPVRGHEVNWTGPRSASCAYCGANLPFKEA